MQNKFFLWCVQEINEIIKIKIRRTVSWVNTALLCGNTGQIRQADLHERIVTLTRADTRCGTCSMYFIASVRASRSASHIVAVQRTRHRLSQQSTDWTWLCAHTFNGQQIRNLNYFFYESRKFFSRIATKKIQQPIFQQLEPNSPTFQNDKKTFVCWLWLYPVFFILCNHVQRKTAEVVLIFLATENKFGESQTVLRIYISWDPFKDDEVVSKGEGKFYSNQSTLRFLTVRDGAHSWTSPFLIRFFRRKN